METSLEYGTIYGLRTPPVASWYCDQQLLATINGMVNSLTIVLSGVELQQEYGYATVIGNTQLNSFYGIYPQSIPPTIYSKSDLEIWQDLLNEALFNITLSLVTEYGSWNTTGTIVTITENINIYTFSQPLNLIISYLLILLLAIPILAIGVFALLKNGVSAIDSGFLQLVTTTTGSPTLEKLAESACLGESESIPQDHKDLEIRFGELVGVGEEGKGHLRKTGFRTSDETVPLIKGMVYGA